MLRFIEKFMPFFSILVFLHYERNKIPKFLWFLLRPLSKLALLLSFRQKKYKATNPFQDSWANFPHSLFEAHTVRNGFFKGMKYPTAEAAGSVLYPKLMGSYEYELREIIGIISQKKYAQIVDIGCAEGYYAIGMALLIPKVEVFAFDIDQKARDLCKDMAESNGVAERLRIGEKCSAETLKNFDFKPKTLIICDCEGYEGELFSEENLPNLRTCDLLIETHDFLNIHLSTYLSDLFANSHQITIIRSLDDLHKAQNYDFEELRNFSIETKYLILAENRHPMEWLFLLAKTN